jgi:hypothetical protein
MLALGATLKENTTLSHVVLQWNAIGTNGVARLVQHLDSNTTLQHIDLDNNRQITEQAARFLAMVLFRMSDTLVACILPQHCYTDHDLAATMGEFCLINRTRPKLRRQELKKRVRFNASGTGGVFEPPIDTPPPLCDMCSRQEPRGCDGMAVEKANAEAHCTTCRRSLCKRCDTYTHFKGAKKKHVRVSMAAHLASL